MTIEKLKETIPDFAKDIRLNLSNLFGNRAQSGLTESQFYGTAMAVAFSLKDKLIMSAIMNDGEAHMSFELKHAAKIAATLMAMNNIYYRAMHLSKNTDLMAMPANLRMNGILNPGVAQIDFELFSLAVSALNGPPVSG